MRATTGRALLLVAVYVYALADWVAGHDTAARYRQELERELRAAA